MDIYLKIAVTVVPVFAIMGAGSIYGRYKKLPVQELSDVLFWIFIPCLVLGSIGSQVIDPVEFLQIGAAGLVVVLGCGVVAWIVYLGRSERRALALSCMFMNSANMAFPLALFAFGASGLSRQVVFYLAVHVLHVTLGVGIARGKGGLREIFRLPLIYAAALAVVLALTGIQIPTEVAKPLNLVGMATLPIMLILLGARLTSVRPQQLGLALIASVLRLGGGFVLGLLAVWLFGLSGLARAAVLLGSVMPSAVFNFVLGEKYRLHPELLATTVVLSTLVSVATTPLFLYIIMD